MFTVCNKDVQKTCPAHHVVALFSICCTQEQGNWKWSHFLSNALLYLWSLLLLVLTVTCSGADYTNRKRLPNSNKITFCLQSPIFPPQPRKFFANCSTVFFSVQRDLWDPVQRLNVWGFRFSSSCGWSEFKQVPECSVVYKACVVWGSCGACVAHMKAYPGEPVSAGTMGSNGNLVSKSTAVRGEKEAGVRSGGGCVCIWGGCRLMVASVPLIWIIHPMGGFYVSLKALCDWLIRAAASRSFTCFSYL